MGRIFTCDRCGKRVAIERASLHFVDKLHYLGVITRNIDADVDLCDACYNSFLNWYHEKGAMIGDDIEEKCDEKRDETGD